MFDALKNFPYSLVAGAPNPGGSGTAITVTAGTGGNFPAAPFNAVVCPAGAIPLAANAEIVRVTVVAGDTLTVTRQQEGTNARNILVGDAIFAAITAKTLTDMQSMNHADVVDPGAAPVAEGATWWNKTGLKFWVYDATNGWTKLLGCLLALLFLVLPASAQRTDLSILRNFATTNTPQTLTNIVVALGTAGASVSVTVGTNIVMLTNASVVTISGVTDTNILNSIFMPNATNNTQQATNDLATYVRAVALTNNETLAVALLGPSFTLQSANASLVQVPTGTNITVLFESTNSAGATVTNTLTVGSTVGGTNVWGYQNSLGQPVVSQLTNGSIYIGTNNQLFLDTSGNLTLSGTIALASTPARFSGLIGGSIQNITINTSLKFSPPFGGQYYNNTFSNTAYFYPYSVTLSNLTTQTLSTVNDFTGTNMTFAVWTNNPANGQTAISSVLAVHAGNSGNLWTNSGTTSVTIPANTLFSLAVTNTDGGTIAPFNISWAIGVYQ